MEHFETIGLRKVENGVIVTLTSEEDPDKEYIFPTGRKAVKFILEKLETKGETVLPK